MEDQPFHIVKCPPSKQLNRFVKGYCIFEFKATKDQMLVPAWAKTMLSFHYGDHFSFKYPDGTEEHTNDAGFIGCTTSPYQYNAPEGLNIKFITIEFHLEVLCSLLKGRMKEITDTSIHFHDFYPKIPYHKIIKTLQKAESDKQKISVVETFMADFLDGIDFHKVRYLNELIASIKESKGASSLKKLSTKFNLSERHLRRILHEGVGIPPKKFMQLIRIEHSIHRLYENPKMKLNSLAYEYGYVDQAHFIKEFKQATSLSPKEMINSNLLESVRHMYS